MKIMIICNSRVTKDSICLMLISNQLYCILEYFNFHVRNSMFNFRTQNFHSDTRRGIKFIEVLEILCDFFSFWNSCMHCYFSICQWLLVHFTAQIWRKEEKSEVTLGSVQRYRSLSCVHYWEVINKVNMYRWRNVTRLQFNALVGECYKAIVMLGSLSRTDVAHCIKRMGYELRSW